jgi:radical SAM superfamily enzyme YgiQ (UPF0313 family)
VAEVVLTTLNAKFAHASFGLRYLMANLPSSVRARAALREFDINQRNCDVLELILAQGPKIVGIGVYIWNAVQAEQLVAMLKRVRPDVIVIIGGPEVSHEIDQQQICHHADYVVTGEADLAFGALCEQLLAGRRPLQKIVPSDLPEFARLKLPYELYDDRDLAQRVVYVEASRGCPFKCEFCLSSLDVPVRNVPLDAFLGAMQRLLDRGLNQFKFVDRTFNLNLNVSRSILEFFLERYRPGLFLHFEMIPDRLPEALRVTIARFPPGALQFEVGIQSFNEDVQKLISRRQDNAKVEENLRWLREQTGVHVHADLIVGLPGEDVKSFARGFDRLVALRPQEIQVGLLKRLRGTPIVRHDLAWGMVYSPHAPYEILQTKLIDFRTMQRLRRFARYWDLIANSGNFIETTELMCGEGEAPAEPDLPVRMARPEPRPRSSAPFEKFIAFSDWLFARVGQTHAIALPRLMQLVFDFLIHQRHADPKLAAQTLWRDYTRGRERADCPDFLRPFVGELSKRPRPRPRVKISLPRRQARHTTSSYDSEIEP